jgi:hypothetical protein
MKTINFKQCLTIAGEVEEYGQFTRIRATLPQSQSEQPVKVVRDIRQQTTWGSLAIWAQQDQTIRLCLDDAQIQHFHSEQGCLIKQSGLLILLPAQPRLLVLDQQGRIQVWGELGWQLNQSGDQVILQAQAGQEGWVEVVWVQLEPAEALELLSSYPLEQETWAIEGCWSRLKGVSDFWQFWALSNIYNGRFAAHGRFFSAQTAWSLYKVAAVLAAQTGKAFYTHFMAEIAYTVLASLNDKGVWINGEWLAEAETHLRFQLDGIHLLLTAYNQFGDIVLLQGAEQAGAFLLQMRDELANGSWWFLHDTLELNEAGLRARYPDLLTHQQFGKQRANTLTLNTHLSALHVLHRLAQITQNSTYQEAYARGMAALQWALSSKKGAFVHTIAAKLLEISFENRAAAWPRRGLRYFIRHKLMSKLTGIQRYWPNFVTPNGYLWRDMALPSWGYWYHLVNLYDLLILYQLDGPAWLRNLIDRAMAFTLKSNLLPYLLAQKHYIVPQWLQILKLYAEINPQFDDQLIKEEIKTVKHHGYGLPPEIFGSGHNFFTQSREASTLRLRQSQQKGHTNPKISLSEERASSDNHSKRNIQAQKSRCSRSEARFASDAEAGRAGAVPHLTQSGSLLG